TERGQLVRIPCNEIRTVGRASIGVRIMNLNDSDRITGVSKVVELDIDKKDDAESPEAAEVADLAAEQLTGEASAVEIQSENELETGSEVGSETTGDDIQE
ncbi:MAG: DNA gyrase C-terminal beta-propeller domain-containing protein, partial [Victivallaceae bacterium]